MKADKIQFHDPADKDPDWKVRNCYLLLIAAATEVENGIEYLWKRGRVGNRCFYPDFGRFMSVNEMKCFYSATPYCWCDEQYWFVPDRDTPWDVVLPCLHLVNTMLLILDESMSGWRPKTSKTWWIAELHI
jgi:hypothetical protein